ncbi:MAG: glutathione transferase [Betaproteobacteria bacterium]|nr:MAG: glutathione transferase [Betaproteobacteria bacterium]
MPNALILYVNRGYTSPYALSTFVTLREKNLAFDVVEIDMNVDGHKQGDYRTRSLTERIPTLVHGDFALSESSAMDEYLEDAFPETPRVYPSGVRERARARQIQAFVRSDLMPIRIERSTSTVFQHEKPAPLSAEAGAAAEKLISFADALIPADSGNLFGVWSIADTDLAMMLNRLVHNGDAVPEKIARYVRSQWARPSVQAWVDLARIANS